MSDNDKSRLKQYEKRRRNNKFITYFSMIASVLIVILIGTWIFGGTDTETTESPNEQPGEEEGFFLEAEDEDNTEEETENSEGEQENDVEVSEGEGSEEATAEENESDVSENEETEREIEYEDVTVQSEETEDENILEAYTGNWPPIGTEQTGPHTTVYADGSQDRIEIRKAVSYVTGIPENEVVDLWIGNGGDQKVIATVTDANHSEIFRVYLSWIDEEGWQPTRFEVLAENDA